ncbi:Hypothetical predicted protein, partial [Paramuricea clavata]
MTLAFFGFLRLASTSNRLCHFVLVTCMHMHSLQSYRIYQKLLKFFNPTHPPLLARVESSMISPSRSKGGRRRSSEFTNSQDVTPKEFNTFVIWNSSSFRDYQWIRLMASVRFRTLTTCFRSNLLTATTLGWRQLKNKTLGLCMTIFFRF